jgi:hypothetical protein
MDKNGVLKRLEVMLDAAAIGRRSGTLEIELRDGQVVGIRESIVHEFAAPRPRPKREQRGG